MRPESKQEGSRGTHKRFIEHHLSYFLPTFYMLSDWIFILLAEHLAVSARNGLMGSSVLHIAWLNKWIVFPLFLFYFYGPGGSIRNRWESGACWSVFLRLCLCHLPHYPLGLLDPHWQFHEPALHCFLGNLFLPFPQPFAPCYDKNP